MLKPVQKQNLSNQVFTQLRDEILNLEYDPGDRLPSERELCDIFHINRSSVREALKRLEQARLIDIRHGEGSVVLNFKLSAGFDLLRHLVMPGGKINFLALRSIAEVRAVIAGEMANLAAKRITEPDLKKLDEIVKSIENCPGDDPARFQDLDFDFHYTLARSSENLAFLLMMNSIKDVYEELKDYFSSMFNEAMKNPGLYRRIAEALARHDRERAVKLTHQLIENGNKAFLSLYTQINGDA